MTYFKHGLVFLALVALCGCKIRITVPEHGHVESISGSYYCASGETCDIDVVDFMFNERFIAVPDAGFAFRWWDSGKGSLCANSTEPCNLSSEALAGMEGGQAIVESDIPVTLNPIFTLPHGSTVLEDVSSSVCFNPDEAEKGYSVKTIYALPNDANYHKAVYARTTLGPAQTHAGLGTKIVTNIAWRGARREKAKQESFIIFDLAEKQKLFTGAKVTNIKIPFTFPENSDTRLALFDFEVGYEFDWLNFDSRDSHLTRFDLEQGEEFIQAEINVTDYSEFILQFSSSFDTRTVYEGLQEVTVPAGTFNACRFHEYISDSFTPENGVTEVVTWIAEQTGIVLMESDKELNPEKILLKVEFK